MDACVEQVWTAYPVLTNLSFTRTVSLLVVILSRTKVADHDNNCEVGTRTMWSVILHLPHRRYPAPPNYWFNALLTHIKVWICMYSRASLLPLHTFDTSLLKVHVAFLFFFFFAKALWFMRIGIWVENSLQERPVSSHMKPGWVTTRRTLRSPRCRPRYPTGEGRTRAPVQSAQALSEKGTRKQAALSFREGEPHISHSPFL